MYTLLVVASAKLPLDTLVFPSYRDHIKEVFFSSGAISFTFRVRFAVTPLHSGDRVIFLDRTLLVSSLDRAGPRDAPVISPPSS